MGHFRFRKSIKIAPGVKLNLNKNSTSITLGGKGAHYTVNSKGTKTTTVGIPGTGLSYVDVQSRKASPKPNKKTPPKDSGTPHSSSENKSKPPILQRNWFLILMLLFASPIGIFLMWYFKEWKLSTKIIISVCFIFYFMVYCGVMSVTV